MLQLALLFLGFGNLLCGFAKTPIQLYCFRAISGLGGGGINGIAMTVVSMTVLRETISCAEHFSSYYRSLTSFP
jgi:MFS family permease